MTDEQTQDEEAQEPEEANQPTDSKHGMDSAQKGVDAEGSKQTDNPDIESTAGPGGEGDDVGGLGDRTGATGGPAANEPGEDHDTAEKRK